MPTSRAMSRHAQTPLPLTDIGLQPMSAAASKAALSHSIADFHAVGDAGIRKWCYDDTAADHAMQLALGNRGSTSRLIMSSRVVRQRAGELLIDHVDTAQRDAMSLDPNRTWYFLSFVDDRAFINSYRPEVDIAAFKRRVDALVRASGLNAVCAIEVQALTNYPGGGLGRTLMLNAHSIGFTDAPFDVVAIERRLRASRRLQHGWGLPTVVIKRIGVDDMPIAWLAYYLLKAPHIAKFRAWNANARPPGHRLHDTSMRPDIAVRLLELLSQLTFNETVWGVHGGAGLVAAGVPSCRLGPPPIDPRQAVYLPTSTWQPIGATPASSMAAIGLNRSASWTGVIYRSKRKTRRRCGPANATFAAPRRMIRGQPARALRLSDCAASVATRFPCSTSCDKRHVDVGATVVSVTARQSATGNKSIHCVIRARALGLDLRQRRSMLRQRERIYQPACYQILSELDS